MPEFLCTFIKEGKKSGICSLLVTIVTIECNLAMTKLLSNNSYTSNVKTGMLVGLHASKMARLSCIVTFTALLVQNFYIMDPKKRSP
jgi:hypothetical protein